jgi:hypothetical protein
VSGVDEDDVLYQAVVDEEFRDRLLAESGAARLLVLPDPVAARNRAFLDLVSGAEFTAQCRSTCSDGPITIICDGTTK